MDFKNQIQNKYQKEVDPAFDESKWQSFLAHRKKKKRRPFLILWFAIGIAVVSAMIWYPNRDGLPESTVKSLPYALPATSAQSLKSPQTIPAKETDPTQASLPGKPNPGRKNTIQHKGRQFSKEASKTSTQNQANQEQIQSFVSENNAQEIEVAAKNVEIPRTQHVAASIPGKNIALLMSPEYRLEEQYPFSVKAPKTHWDRSSYAGQLYGGLAHPFHVQTIEEKAFQFGGKLYYHAGKKVRLKTGFELGSISFVSKIMNPHLGVDLIEAPSDIVQFDHAIVESVNVNIEIGIDRLIYSRNAWKSYAGISYLLAKEITKDIDYTFAGTDDFSTIDDVLVSKKDAAKYFVPHILKFETGLQYQSPIGGINLSFSFPYQIAKTNVELLRQLQISFGFIHRL